jgi:hypothetical protein
MPIFTQTELEVIVLKMVWDSIDEMVNYEMFAKLASIEDVTLMFKSMTHQRLFNVLLVDFLSQPRQWPFGLGMPAAGVPTSERSILFHLKRVCLSPQLSPGNGMSIRSPLDALQQWLETECQIEKVWLPSINLETTINVKRVKFIKICGDIAKHSFGRLSRNVDAICEILKSNGAPIERDEGYLVLPDFYEWFHKDVFSYHSSALGEFLNNLRWGLYEYLQPEYSRSFSKDEPPSIKYRYRYPLNCVNPIARSMYWDLMNAVRSKPYMPRFEVTRYLKMRY